jgi:sphingosine kinase
MLRDDWDQFKDSITLGGVPGGTGNGLIKSLLSNLGEDYGVQEAAWLVLRGNRDCIDLTKLSLEYHTQPVYSFLSVAWSVIADIDLNSEVMRCLGPLRFDLWGVWRVLSLLECRGTFSMKDSISITN